METNKLIGYTTIQTSDGELSLKVGMFVLERFCDYAGVSLEEIYKVMEVRTVEHEGEKVEIVVPKNYPRALAIILHFGVNYVRGIEGKSKFPIEKAYEWIDEIGVSNPKMYAILNAFMECIRTASPAKIEDEDPKKKEKQSP